jgi:hypothetical protein
MKRSEAGPSASSAADESSVLAERSVPACPFCQARETALVSPFGCQHMTAQYRCSACASYFEAVRDDR